MELIFKCARVVDFSFQSSHFIYNNPIHLVTQSKSGWWHYTAAAGKSVVAEVYFNLKLKVASSPFRAPFSGFEIKKQVSSAQLTSFLRFILDDLKNKKVTEVRIKNAPQLLEPKPNNNLHQALTQAGFQYEEEVASLVQIDQNSLLSKMVPAKRNRLRKSAFQLGFKAEPLQKLKEVYNFLSLCRQERGQALSMNYSDMLKFSKGLPQNLLLYSVSHQDEMVAAAFVIKVNNSVLYTFYYGHLRKFDKLSPIPFLLDQLYGVAKKEGYQWVDLGTSMLNNSINRPLLHFKKSIGAITTVKRSYLKVL